MSGGVRGRRRKPPPTRSWDYTAETAIEQIKERKYPSTLEAYSGQILLVGISYERKSKKHQCVIEKYHK